MNGSVTEVLPDVLSVSSYRDSRSVKPDEIAAVWQCLNDPASFIPVLFETLTLDDDSSAGC